VLARFPASRALSSCAFLDGDPLADVVELFVRREDAETFLAEFLEGPGWVKPLAVVEATVGKSPAAKVRKLRPSS
jgi:hypothetical protein